VFTFLDRVRIDELEKLVATEPFRREAQRTLAFEVTSLVHGVAATESAIAASAALFGQGELASLDAATVAAATAELPSAEVAVTVTVAQALVDTGLTKGLGESRRAIAQGGVYLNNVTVTDEGADFTGAALASGHAILRRGKKTLAAVLIAS